MSDDDDELLNYETQEFFLQPFGEAVHFSQIVLKPAD